jgi:hypothetical protein
VRRTLSGWWRHLPGRQVEPLRLWVRHSSTVAGWPAAAPHLHVDAALQEVLQEHEASH